MPNRFMFLKMFMRLRMKITNYKFIKSQSSFNCSRIVDGGRSDANFHILMRCTKKP